MLLLGGAALWRGSWVADPAVSPPYSGLHATLIRDAGVPAGLDGRLSGFEERPAEDRGGAGHGPEPLAFSGDDLVPLARELLQVDAEVERRLSERATAEDLATAGALELLKGRTAEAVTLLERAAKASPSDARILSDLALARAELARERGRPHLLVDALEAALQAMNTDPGSAEATFNAAVLLDDLGLWNQAREAWEDYLDLDRSSRWAGRARASLDELSERLQGEEPPSVFITKHGRLRGSDAGLESLVRLDPYRARRTVEEEILPGWAKAYQRGDPLEARQWLASGRRLGRILAEVQGDTLLADSVRVIDRTYGVEDEARLSHLATGHLAYREGLESVLYDDCAAPQAPVSRAARSLQAAGSPFFGWASVQSAICHYYDGSYAEAWRHLDDAGRIAARGDYRLLQGRALWIAGLVAMVEGELARSLAHYEEAVRLFGQAAELDHAAYLRSLVAKDLRLMGAPDEAWVHRIEGLRRRHRVPGGDRRYTILQEAAEAVQEGGGRLATKAFLDELVAEAFRGTTPDTPDLLGFALIDRAEAATAAGNRRVAEIDLLRVSRELASLPPDFQLRSRLALAHEVTSGLLDAALDPEGAVQRLRDAIEYYAGSSTGGGEQIELARAYLERAKLLLGLGRVLEAEADLEAGIHVVELHGRGISDPQLQLDFHRMVRELYLQMIELQLDLGRPELALDYLQRSPGRSFGGSPEMLPDERERWEGLSRRGGGGCRSVQCLPPGAHGIAYAALRDDLAIWIFGGGGGMVSERIGIGRKDLERRVGEFTEAIAGRAGEAEVQRLGGELFELLIPAKLRGLPRKSTLLIVPGPDLWRVPFAALWDEHRGRYLIEDYAFTVLPASALSDRSGSGPMAWTQPLTAGVITDPAFDRGRFPRLARLPEASASATFVRDVFVDTTVLSGDAANRRAVLEMLGHADIVYFAGHAVVAPGSIGPSGLLLAPAGPSGLRRDDLLTAEDLHGHVGGVKLLFLDGCRTGLGAWGDAGDIGSLASAMVASGVPAVVASLWDVDDRAAYRFSRELFAALGSGSAPPRALREAVVRIMQQERDPADWAAYTLVGHPFEETADTTH